MEINEGKTMKALIIIACVIVYLVMWVVTGVIGYREGWRDSPESSAGFGFFWWITLFFIGASKLIFELDYWLTCRKTMRKLK